MKTIWNLIGKNFIHTTGGHTGKCGTHGKLPDNIEWSFDYGGDTSFYIDWFMFDGINDRPEFRKFGWLLESKSIRPKLFEKVKANYELLFETYEAIFTHNAELIALDDRFRFTLTNGYWIHNIGIHPKTKLLSAISSGKNMCEGHRWRNRMIELHRDRFDLYGNKYQHIQHKETGLNDYMFSVAIENGSYASYFTEKILDCFATGTIPIYKGAPDIGNFFNVDGILFIDADFSFDMLTPDLYYEKMDAIKDNFSRVSAYKTAEDYIYETYKDVYWNLKPV